jgi:DNA-directed RNA polymerase specialized sigma24 family protein
MIAQAKRAAACGADIARSRFFVEADDLVGPAIMAALAGRPMRFGVIDGLRSLGGRLGNSTVARRSGQTGAASKFLAHQFEEKQEVGTAEPNYIARLALKRCGVLILDCLPPRLRKVMLLRYWHDLTQVEVGRIMGFTITETARPTSKGASRSHFPKGTIWRNCSRVQQLEREAIELIRGELQRRGIRSMRDLM